MCLDIVLGIIATTFETIDNSAAADSRSAATISKFSTKKPVQEYKEHDPAFVATECLRLLEEVLGTPTGALSAPVYNFSTNQQSGGQGTGPASRQHRRGSKMTALAAPVSTPHSGSHAPSHAAEQLTMKDIHGLEAWSSFVCLANQVGRWQVRKDSSAQDHSILSQDDSPTTLRMPLTTYRPYPHRENTFLELARQVLERVMQLVANANKVEEVTSSDSVYSNLLSLTSEQWRNNLHSHILGLGGAARDNVALTAGESTTSRVFLVLADPQSSSRQLNNSASPHFNPHLQSVADLSPIPKSEVWELICNWLGGPVVAMVWDVEESVKLGQRLAAFSASAQEVIQAVNPKDAKTNIPAAPPKTIGELVRLVFSDSEFPHSKSIDPLFANPVPEALLKLVAEVVDASSRLLCVKEAVDTINDEYVRTVEEAGANSAAADEAVTPKTRTPDYSSILFPFTECTIAAVNGQCLFLRSYLRHRILEAAAGGAAQERESVRIPSIVFASVGRFTGRNLPIEDRLCLTDAEAYPSIFHHFLRGNLREGGPVSDPSGAIAAAVAAESGAIAKYQAALAAAAAAAAGNSKDKTKASSKPAGAALSKDKNKAGTAGDSLECAASLTAVLFLGHIDEPPPAKKSKAPPAMPGTSPDTEKNSNARMARTLRLRDDLGSVLFAFGCVTGSHPTNTHGTVGHVSTTPSAFEDATRKICMRGLPVLTPYVYAPPTDAAGKPGKVDPAVTAAVATLNGLTMPLPVYTLKRKFVAASLSAVSSSQAMISVHGIAKAASAAAATSDEDSVTCLQYTGPLLFAETAVSCVIDAIALGFGFQSSFQSKIAAIQQLPVPPTGIDAIFAGVNFCDLAADALPTRRRIVSLTEQRRSTFPTDIRMCFDHLAGKHSLNTTHSVLVHEKLCQCVASELQLFSLHLLSQGSMLRAIESNIRQREAALVNMLKSEDARWQQLCRNTLESVSSLLAGNPLNPASLTVDTSVDRGIGTGLQTRAEGISTIIANAREEVKAHGSALATRMQKGSATLRKSQTQQDAHIHARSKSDEQAKLQQEIDEKANFELRLLVCKLGDIIDERHMRWIDKSNAMFVETDLDYNRLRSHCNRIIVLMSVACHQIMESKRDAVEGLVNLLSNAGYVTMPWATTAAANVHLKPLLSHKLIEKRKGNLRESLQALPSEVAVSSLLMNALGGTHQSFSPHRPPSRPVTPAESRSTGPNATDPSSKGAAASQLISSAYENFLSLEVPYPAESKESAGVDPNVDPNTVAPASSAVPVANQHTREAMLGASMSELFAEQLCAATAVVSATSEVLSFVLSSMEAFKVRNDGFITSRHTYEHKMLWAGALVGRGNGAAAEMGASAPAASLAAPSDSSFYYDTKLDIAKAVDFLGSYHFGLSDEVSTASLLSTLYNSCLTFAVLGFAV
jgi:hypothetical protein